MKMKEATATVEKTVSVYLPGKDNGPFVEGALNGVNFRIPTDTLVEVPERIARVLKESRRSMLEGEHSVEAFRTAGGRKIG